MKPAVLFLAKFVALTATCIWLWQTWGLSVYHAIYSPIATAIYEGLGFEGIATPARDRYINIIPFLTLMILTPNLSTRRRYGGTAIGLAILFFMHIAANLTAYPQSLRLPRIVSLMLDAAPFFLWVVICHEFVRGFMQRAIAGSSDERPTHGPRD